MNDENTEEVRAYLNRFNQILCDMAIAMLSPKATDNITIDFIRCMISHHQAAIYMCENLLKYTNYEPLEEIVHNIIQMQTEGIEHMKEVLRTTRENSNSLKDVVCYRKQYLFITKNMIERMKNSPRCRDINIDFVKEMIPHHEGAIAMCQNLLQYPIDSRFAIITKSIIQEQSNSVKQLRQIKKNLCGQ